MATNGSPQNSLDTFPPSLCKDYIYGKTTKRPCNIKMTRSVNEYKLVASVGECVSVDVLFSSTPGLIYHMSGFIMRQRCQYAFIFVDNHSDFTYVHLLNF